METAVLNHTNIAFSGSIPAQYDKGLGPLFFEPFAREISKRVDHIKPTAILELACGTGRLTRYLASSPNYFASLVATDINPAMLGFAKGHIGSERIQWDVVDAVTIPYEDESFDLVVVQFGVMFYSDKAKAFAEARRVLKPGGTLLFTTWDSLRHNPIAHLTDNVVTEYFPENTPAFYQVPFSYHDETMIRTDLLSGGFTSADIQLVKLQGYSPSALDAAVGLLEGSPIHTEIMQRAPELLPVLEEKLSVDIEAIFGEKDLTVPIQARIVTAVKY